MQKRNRDRKPSNYLMAVWDKPTEKVPVKLQGLRKLTAAFSNKLPEEVLIADMHQLVQFMHSELDKGTTPNELGEILTGKKQYTFICTLQCLPELCERTMSQHAYFEKVRQNRKDKATTELRAYREECAFTFNPYDYLSVDGFGLLQEFGMFSPRKNPNGVTRDHMVSVKFGFDNGIDPSIIKHPANCQYMSNKDNARKNFSCSITIEQLMERIANGTFTPIEKVITPLTHSEEHRANVAKALKAKRWIHRKFNDCVEKRHIMKSEPTPDGWTDGAGPHAKSMGGGTRTHTH